MLLSHADNMQPIRVPIMPQNTSQAIALPSRLLLLLINVAEFGNLIAYFIGPLLLVSSFFFLKKSEKAFLYEKYNSLQKLIKNKNQNNL